MNYKKYLLSFAVLLLAYSTYAQEPKLKGKEKTNWIETTDLIELKDYLTAKLFLDDFLKKYPDWAKANYYMGLCYFKLKIHEDSSLYYFKKAADGDLTIAYYYLGRLYHYKNLFEKEKEMYEKYLSKSSTHEISKEKIAELVTAADRAAQFLKNSSDITLENMGPKINTKYPEYAPLITSDEEMLIFTSRRPNGVGGKLDPYGKYFEDIYVSYKEGNQWSTPEQLGSGINDELHNACVGLSPEGNTLITYKTNKTLDGGDLYWTEYTNKTWTKPTMFSEKINSKYVESSASYTPDGNTIYFSSDRPGGYGGKDIYKSVKLPNGEWSLPVNLGDHINTRQDDDAPYIHPNGRLLYFCSKGHNSIGEYDIFKSEWLDDESNWSSPENLGAPINSTRDDVFFSISADGKTGYFSSMREEGYGDQDLYQVSMPGALNTVIKGKILSSHDSTSAVKATILLESPDLSKTYGIYKSNARTGNYLLLANQGKMYHIIIEAEGFETLEINKLFKKEDFDSPLIFFLNQSK